MSSLKARYGTLEDLYQQSRDTEDLETRLREFKGIGPVTAQIFLREMRGIWDINPEVSDKALKMAEWLDIDLDEFSGERLSRVETALIKLYLRYCMKKNTHDARSPMWMEIGLHEVLFSYQDAPLVPWSDVQGESP